MVINITQTRCKNAFFELPRHVKKSDFYKNKKSHGSKKNILRSHFSKILKIENESIPKNTQKITFHKQLVDLENILKRNIPEDISLAKFIELQKSIKNVTK
jgi:hypothetical protein